MELCGVGFIYLINNGCYFVSYILTVSNTVLNFPLATGTTLLMFINTVKGFI